jgi:hypothetical protein
MNMATQNKPVSFVLKGLMCAAFVGAILPDAARAQSPGDCVKLPRSGLILAVSNYNPFSGSEQASGTGQLLLERNPGFSGAFDVKVQLLDTDSVAGRPAIGTTGLTGVDVTAGGSGILKSGSPDFGAGGKWVSRFFDARTPQVTIPMIRLRVPGALDVAASNGAYTESLDLVVECSQGGQVWTQSAVSAVQLQVAVQSRLRATVVGSVNAGSVAIDPATGSAGSGLRVASSGPFSLEVQSENNFELRVAGGNPTPPADQRAAYTMQLAGESFGGSTSIGATRQCARTGLAGETLPLNLQLASNANRLRSGAYSDTLTITVTPMVSGPVTGCSS